MKIGPKYKIARRLGAPIFEKTQTQKYSLRSERKNREKSRRPASEFSSQLNEKQKARFTYGISERQFSKYVKEVIAKKTFQPSQLIFKKLESRLDNVVYRTGFAPTRFGAKQMVSHGHILINGKRNTISSTFLKEGDVVSIREGSLNKGIFTSLEERMKSITVPSWIDLDFKKKEAKIKGEPKYSSQDNMFDLNVVVEFYSR